MRNRKLLITAIMAVVVFTLVFAFAGCAKEIDTSSDAAGEAIYNVNGYQLAPKNVSAITKEGGKIVPIQDMLDATGIKVDKKGLSGKDATVAAANIYHMIVRNAANTIGTGYQVATNASVDAAMVEATIGFKVKMDSFSVGLRSTYSSMDGPNGHFSQTVSGVTKLFLEGALEPIGDAIKGNFGYNIQQYSNDKFSAERNGGNGGAKFWNFDEKLSADAPKLILGATIGKDPLKAFPRKLNNGKKYFKVTPAKAKAAKTAAEEFTGNYWDELTPHYFDGDPIKIQLPGQEVQEYPLGNMGCGWALYNFNANWLDPDKTTVTYDKDRDVYTLKISVLSDYTDQACEFAKNTLIKDTCNYVILDHPKYTRLENTIEVHGCGLIKSWVRDELMESNKKAYLTVFTGGPAGDVANGGGSTGNKSISVFSYDERDYNPERMAALYWPELGDSDIMAKAGVGPLDLSKLDSYETYKPVINNK